MPVTSHETHEETGWTINYNKRFGFFLPCLRKNNIKLIYGNYGISLFMWLSELYKERPMTSIYFGRCSGGEGFDGYF